MTVSIETNVEVEATFGNEEIFSASIVLYCDIFFDNKRILNSANDESLVEVLLENNADN